MDRPPRLRFEHRHRPDLRAERLGPRKGAKRWDTTIMGVHGILQLAVYLVAGLDHRYAWSSPLPAAVQAAALVVCSLGSAWTCGLRLQRDTSFGRAIQLGAHRQPPAIRFHWR